MKRITREQALAAMEQGEFEKEVTGAADRVAVILTQSWCPQWHDMRRFAAEAEGVEVFYLEYDKSDIFEAFRTFKERTWGNDQIPYVRYYRGGKLVGVSNAVPETAFRGRFG